MSAALIAAALTALAAPASAGLDNAAVRPADLLADLQKSQEACAHISQKTVDQHGAKLRRLDQLPWGLIEHAVLRSVGGCPVREVVYQGQVYWVPGTAPRVGRADPSGQLQKQK
jgi:hypothetical protein